MNTESVSEPLAPLRLKKNEERRLRAGHVWVYSNEVDTAATPLKAFSAGQQVQLLAHSGKPLGNAYVNPNSLICARLVSRDPRHVLDRSLIVHRLNVALALRQQLFDAPFYRLVYGEADQLPGLVIDRYDSVCVVQCTTAGMEAVKDEVLAAVEKVMKPTGILWRADSPVRKLEGLESYREEHGVIPEFCEVIEHGVRFPVSLREGQKTGWFYDQRMNRERLRHYVAGKRVLDVGKSDLGAQHRLVGSAVEAVELPQDFAGGNVPLLVGLEHTLGVVLLLLKIGPRRERLGHRNPLSRRWRIARRLHSRAERRSVSAHCEAKVGLALWADVEASFSRHTQYGWGEEGVSIEIYDMCASSVWQKRIKGANRGRMTEQSGGFAAGGNQLYVADEFACLVLDAASGEEKRKIPIPRREDKKPRRWGWLAYDNGMLYGSRAETHIDRIKHGANRSELAVPGSRPELFEKAAKSAADVIFLDLEDSVAPDEKAQARRNIAQAIEDVDWGGKTLSLRINGLDTHYMYRDVVDVLEQTGERLDLIMIPKAGAAADIYAVDMLVTQIETAKGRRKRIGFEMIIETALGMMNVDEIAAASPRAVPA